MLEFNKAKELICAKTWVESLKIKVQKFCSNSKIFKKLKNCISYSNSKNQNRN